MAFSHSSDNEIIGSTLNDIGRDLNVIHGIQIGSIRHLSIYLSQATGPPPLPALYHRDAPACPIPDRQSQQTVLSIVPTSELSGVTANPFDTATGLIVQIVQSLIEHQQSERRDLKLEPKALYESLVLAKAAIQEYEDKPLGPSLTKAVLPEVYQCSRALLELLGRVNGTWQGLYQTSIRDLWRPVWWGLWDGNDLASLRTKLSESRESLRGFLMALNSVTWIELGNDLRSGHIPLSTFYKSLRERLPPLRYIQLESVLVVDHLGQNMPIPTIFCSTWKAFNHIIIGYCRDRVGHHYVEQGDFLIVSAGDNKKIAPIDLATEVKSKPGTVLEMSIALRQTTSAFQGDRMCPRCRHLNLTATASNGWIHQRCSGQFQFEKRLKTSYADNENDTGSESGGVYDEGDSREADGESHEEIFSPASQTDGGYAKQEDETQFFRRISVIYTEDNSSKLKRVHFAGDIYPPTPPPPYASPPYAQPLYPPSPSAHMSSRIHPALSATTYAAYIFYDVSWAPATAKLHPTIPARILSEPATHPPLLNMTILNRHLPWSTGMMPTRKPGTYVTIADVLDAIYRKLRTTVTEAEYRAIPTQERRLKVALAYRRRYERILDVKDSEVEKAQGMRRIDFLAERNIFAGLSSTSHGPDVWELNVLPLKEELPAPIEEMETITRN